MGRSCSTRLDDSALLPVEVEVEVEEAAAAIAAETLPARAALGHPALSLDRSESIREAAAPKPL